MKLQNTFFAFLFLLAISIFLSACATNREDEYAPNAVANNELPKFERRPGVYPDTIRLYDLIGNPQTTWQDVDQYYKTVIYTVHKNTDYFDNLRKYSIFEIINRYNLTATADKKTVEYYAYEQMSLPFVDPNTFIPTLEGLRGFWSDAKIKAVAQTEYEDLQNYIQHHTKDPKGVMERNKDLYAKFQTYAESGTVK